MLNQRYGVLEVQQIIDNMAECICLAHPNRPPFTLKLSQLQDGARQCPACFYDSQGQRRNAANHTGERFGGYVTIKNIGLSRKATNVRNNQQQWRGTAKLQYNYCQHKYWLCYCVYCHAEREIRGDALRSGKLPRCGCQKNKD